MPLQGEPSQVHLAFLRPVSFFITYDHMKLNMAEFGIGGIGEPNIFCCLYRSNCKNSEVFHSDQSDCFIKFRRKSFFGVVSILFITGQDTVGWISLRTVLMLLS